MRTIAIFFVAGVLGAIAWHAISPGSAAAWLLLVVVLGGDVIAAELLNRRLRTRASD